MHDSYINYLNQLNPAEKTITTTQLELYFAEQKTRSCYLIEISVPLHHVEFSIVFLKLINIYLVTVSLVFIVWRLFK